MHLSKIPTQIIGLVMCIALAGYYAYLIVTSTVTPTADTETVSSTTLSTEIFNDQIFNTLQVLNINGPLPISLQQGDLGNAEPF